MMDRVDGARCVMNFECMCVNVTCGVLLWDRCGRCDTLACHLVLGDGSWMYWYLKYDNWYLKYDITPHQVGTTVEE